VSDRDTKVSDALVQALRRALQSPAVCKQLGEFWRDDASIAINNHTRSLQPASGEKVVCGNDECEDGKIPDPQACWKPCPDCTSPTDKAKQPVLVVDDAPYNIARDDGPEASPPDPFGTDKAKCKCIRGFGEECAACATTDKAAGGANNYHDAYRGARDDLLMWKRRALEAEANSERLASALAKEVNGGTFMGEPVAARPSPPTAPAAGMKEALDLLRDCAEHFKTLRKSGVFVWPNHPMNPEKRIAELLAAPAAGMTEAKSQAEQMSDPVYVLGFIANAKRFDKFHFDDDTAFADWVQSLARHVLAARLGGGGT
jgi:hypothetical protein